MAIRASGQLFAKAEEAKKKKQELTGEKPAGSPVTDLARVALNVAEQPKNIAIDIGTRIASSFLPSDTNTKAISEMLKGKSNTQAVDKLATPLKLLGLDEAADKFKSSLIDEKGKVQPTETVTGAVASLAPYLAGGMGFYKAAGTALPKAGNFLKGTISGILTDQALMDTDAPNLFNAASEFLDEGDLKTFSDFMSIKEDDSHLEQRVKLIGEGGGIGLMVDLLGGTVKAGAKAYKTFKKKLPELTDEERGELVYQYLKEAKETSDLKVPEDKIVLTETPEGSAQVQLQANSKVRKFLNRFLTTRGYFTPKAYNAFEDSQYAQRQVIAHAENISNRLQKSLNSIVNEVEKKEVVDTVTDLLSKDISWTRGQKHEDKVFDLVEKFNLPKDVAEEVINSRELIDTMSAKLVGSSAVKDSLKETIVENSGQYIRRSYRLFEDSGYKPTESVRLDAEDFLTDLNLKRDPNLSETFARQQAKDQVDNILKEGDPSEFANYFESVRKVNKNILSQKKDIPDPIRALMGEVTEPSENVLITVSKMVNLLETNKFYKNLEQLGHTGGYIFKEGQPRDNNTFSAQITGTNTSLDGQYTTPEILDEIKGKTARFLDPSSGAGDGISFGNIYRSMLTVKGVSQKLKTVYSHITHIRNFTGGAQFGVANGVNPYGGEAQQTFKTLANSVKQGGDKELDALYGKYLRLGIINTNVRVNEFRALLDAGYEANADNLTSRLSKNLEKIGVSKETQTLLDKVYVATDDFYKINYYNSELATLRKAMPEAPIEVLEEQAADIVRNTMPNYDRVPKGIKALKDFPIGSFFSFPAEIVRTSKNIVKQSGKEILSGVPDLKARGLKRAAGFTVTTTGWAALANFTGQMAGFGDEEQKAIAVLSETPWSKDSPRNVVRVGDKIYTNDTQFVDSYSAIKEPFRAAHRSWTEGEITEAEFDKRILDATASFSMTLLKPYVDEAILTDAIVDVATAVWNSNGRDRNGKELFTPGLSMSEKTGNFIYHLGETLMPGSATTLYKSFDQRPNKSTGKVKDWKPELAAHLTGFKFKELDIENTMKFAVRDYKRKTQEVISIGVDYRKSSGQIVGRYKQRQETKLKLSQDLYRKVKASEMLIGTRETRKYLRDHGMSKSEANTLINGDFYPDKPDRKLRALINEKTPLGKDETARKVYSELHSLYSNFKNTSLIDPLQEIEVEKKERTKKVEGGLVGELVPNAPKNPSARINKYTGVSYAEEAGAAFMDELNPVRSLKMAEGGKVRNRKYSGGVIAKALGIKGADLEWAKSQRQRYPEKEAYDGKGDAAAHLALGFITQRSKNPKAALAAANIREYVTMDTVGRPMDIHNNKLGAEIKAKNFKEAEKEIDRLIKESSAKFMTPSESKERRKYSKGQLVGKVIKYFADKKESGLFSKAEKEAGNLDQKEGTGDVMLKRLRDKGVTDEELEWTGAKDKFAAKPSVTKEEIQQHLKETNFDVETKKGTVGANDTDAPSFEDIAEMFEDDPEFATIQWLRNNSPGELEGMDDLSDDAYEALVESVFKRIEEQETGKGIGGDLDFTANRMHLDFAFEGGNTKNYREITVALPTRFKKIDKDFTHSHFPTLKNFVAHLRLADVKPKDGNSKVLLIDEIQSDAHQKAKGSYITKENVGTNKLTVEEVTELKDKKKELVEQLQKINSYYEDGILNKAEHVDNKKRVRAEIKTIDDSLPPEVPDLPFKNEKKWALLGLRKAMIEAADGGYDEVALTTGRMQAKRNQQIEVVDGVETGGEKMKQFYDKTLIKLLDSNFAKKYGVKIELKEIMQNGEPVKLPVMEVTDKMREDILKGLPMFAEGGLVASEVLTNKLRSNNGV